MSHCLQNPCKPSRLGFDRGRKADYPKELQQMFLEGPLGGYAWTSPKNPALLDYKGAKIVLIGSSPDIGASFVRML